MSHQTKQSSKPTHYVSQKKGYGKQASFQNIGVAWQRKEGGMYVKLHGTQIVEGGFYILEHKEPSPEGGV